MTKLEPGKLSPEFLEKFLKKYRGARDNRLVVGPKYGEDAAIIDDGNKYLVVKTDPITFATDATGWYAVNVNANDIATRGAKPKWYQCTILLPEKKTTKKIVEKIFQQTSEACKQLGVAITGGHTEVTYGLDRPIVVGSMLGEVEKSKLVTTCGAKVGDHIILTKGIVIEGTSIIAREKECELKTKGYSKKFIESCKQFLYDPGISVVKDALSANQAAKVNCMHDPTEGGIANGLYEIARASGNGLLIYENKIPIFDESRVLCKEYSLNPLGAITSGSLLLTANPSETKKILQSYKNNGIPASIIGQVENKKYGMKIISSDGKMKNLAHSEKDEITKLFKL